MNNGDIYKKEIEQFLQEIKKNKLDILILQRQNENLCKENNTKIEGFQDIIKATEKEIELNLKESGEKKIDTPVGWCSFRTMPDKWEYDDVKIIDWCKKIGVDYFHTVEVLEKMNLKKDIQAGIVGEAVPGLTVTPQKPKFGYKIKEVI